MRSPAIVLRAFSISAAAMSVGCGGSQPPLAPGATSDTGGHALPHHETFQYTGKKQLFTVPLFVTRITAVALGAAGGGGSSYIEPSVKRFRLWRGWKTATGDGLVVISWQ